MAEEPRRTTQASLLNGAVTHDPQVNSYIFQENFAALFRSTFGDADNNQTGATDFCGDLPQVSSELAEELTKPTTLEKMERVLEK